MKICLVVANYYPKISKGLIKGASKILIKNALNKFKIVYTTGIYEIPVIIAKKIDRYDAFLALGCVIKGQTPHFNFISKATFTALMNLSIKNKKPIGNGIITCLNKNQAIKRSNHKKKNKGSEATKAIISVLKN